MLWQRLFLLLTAVFVLGDYYGLQSSIYGAVLATIAILVLFSVCKKKWPSLKLAVLSCLLLFLYLGFFSGYSQRLAIIEHNIAPFLNKQVDIQGYIQATPPIRSERTLRLQVNLEQIEQQSYPKYLVNIYLPPTSVAPPAGSLIALQAELREIHYFNNPSNFDLREKSYLRNIVGNIYLKNDTLTVLSQPSQESILIKLQKFSDSYRKRLLQIMPAQQAALVQALVLGGSRDIPASIWQDFTLTGLIHVLCISGMHTSLIAFLILGVCRFFLKNERIAALIAIGCVLIYMMLTGLSMPIVRAGIMSILLICGLLVGRAAYTPAIFAFTLLIMVATKANIILELSFQLTFLATGALIFVTPSLHRLIDKEQSALSLSLAAVCSVQLVLLPILVNNFHQLSIIAFLSNILLVPLVEIIIILIVFGSVFIFAIPVFGKIVLVTSSILLDAVVAANSTLAAWPLSSINIPHLPAVALCMYYILLALFVWHSPMLKNIQYYRELIASLFVSTLVVFIILQPQKSNNTQIHFIDVGQGDAALIVSKHNRAILIDTGGISPTFDIGERVLNPYLRYLGLEQIELLILSHAHFDHAAGSIAVSKSFPVRNLILPANSKSPLTDELQRNLPQSNLLKAQLGSLQLDEWQLQILHVPQTNNENDSLVVLAKAYDFSALFTADIDATIENLLLPQLTKVDILKVAHHGSAQSSSAEFLQTAQPKLAVISVGKNNRYRHPASQTLERLTEQATKVLRTDEYGAIVITLRPEKFFINTNKKGLR